MIEVAPAAAPRLLPTRAAPRGTQSIRTLFDVGSTAPQRRVLDRPESLVRAYGGALEIPLAPGRPVVVANFASTLDGVVAMDRNGVTGGGDVSGFSPSDRFVMGLLRSAADTIVLGAGTVRSSSRRSWAPEAIAPGHADEFAKARRLLGLAPHPDVVIVTSTGDLDPRHPALADPDSRTVIVGPGEAIQRLHAAGLGRGIDVRVLPADAGPRPIDGLATVLADLSSRVALYEGGPTLFGALVEAGLVDELFLTVSPQLVGRSQAVARLALVEEAALWPSMPTWATLRSVRTAGDHLLLRYRLAAEDS